MTQEFYPTDPEQQLYDEVSDYLRRDVLYALPTGQRTLITMVLRKLLDSSSFAIGDTLEALLHRPRGIEADTELAEAVGADFEAIDEVEDEWEEKEALPPAEDGIDQERLADEIKAVEGYLGLARRIQGNYDGRSFQSLP